MSTLMFKSSSLNYTPVSNVFIEKHMVKARGEFVKVYLLLLKYSLNGEPGVSSSILASALNLLESDIMNALNYWSDEGVIKLVSVDKYGNYNIEFMDLSYDENSSSNKDINLLEELNKNSLKDALGEIESLLGRPLSPTEMSTYISWQNNLGFSLELILLLIQYCVSKGKYDSRYFEKVALAWHDAGIKNIDEAQNYIKKHEDKWSNYRKILSFLGIKDVEIMKPQEELLDKWVNTWDFSVDVIQQACKVCFERLGRADFKYIDGILNSWKKDNIKTLQDIANKDTKKATSKKQKFNASPYSKGNFNNFEQRSYDFESLERKLLGWDKDDD